MIEYTITKTGTCSRLEDVPKGARIDAVDDKACIAMCEACGKPILEGDRYTSDSEGIELCGPCFDEMMAAEAQEPQRRVTHEMALDAGDPSLEGELI